MILNLEVWKSNLTWAQRLRDNKIQQIEDETEYLMNEYFDLYVGFAILEGRIEGELEAVEGIRIVKERRRDGGTENRQQKT